ncbi:poly(3-hydroxybutyrate) depolymerase [Candidatus Scalindua japonica]|uniref:Poly(3-hydroxybutyrate) depolymerase n=1 Tax=Candidatus Scalindua japonica TaxID=1284222 RepID=A0A286TUZ5_9BACT|nr:PHB depolymerase family esterase [Candidatus Scalindua japonica]GAX59665.1 poly(3-hydroxybutyrate) depolymerase [Candidatus Scalindua japonica]
MVLFYILFPRIVVAEKGQSTYHELVVKDVIRSYIVYKPIISDTKNVPVMIVLHGGLGNAKYMEKMTGMNDVADTGKFIVVYPNGTGGRFFKKNRRTWNAGRCCGRAVRGRVDDTLFIEKVIEGVNSKFSIDTRRVYVTGMSNGAMMAYRLACEIPDKIAAIIPVSGTLAVGNCDEAKNIPVLHIHGDRDNNVPYDGGKGSRSVAGVSHRSVPDTMELILKSRQPIPLETKEINSKVRVLSYRCSNGAPVDLMVIKGGAHVWPGGQGRNNRSSGHSQISASKQAWEFAKQFSKEK